MRIFKDKERELDWVSFENIKEKKCQEAIGEINSWSGSPNIERFIVSGMLCGDFLTELYSKVSPAFIGSDDRAKRPNDFLYFLYDASLDNDTLAGAAYLSNQTLIDELAVEYLVINPNLQNMGIGTRFVRSLKENMSTLSSRETNNVITTIVDKENIPSIKLFSKICKPVISKTIIGNTNKFWYFSSREMEKDIKG